jgi:hypothetical protein
MTVQISQPQLLTDDTNALDRVILGFRVMPSALFDSVCNPERRTTTRRGYTQAKTKRTWRNHQTFRCNEFSHPKCQLPHFSFSPFLQSSPPRKTHGRPSRNQIWQTSLRGRQETWVFVGAGRGRLERNPIMNPYIADLLAQPSALRELLRNYMGSALEELHEDLKHGKFDRIIVTGMGSSLNAAYPAMIRLCRQPVPVQYVNAAEQ